MVELSVCIGSSCHLKGAPKVIGTFQALSQEYGMEGKLNFKGEFCMKECAADGVAVRLNGGLWHVRPEEAEGFFRSRVLAAVESDGA